MENQTNRTYYEAVFKRTNAVKEAIFNFFLAICSWPRLLLEVFTRRNMGVRYFSLSTAVLMVVLLSLVPFFAEYGMELLSSYARRYMHIEPLKIIGQNFSWYLFLAAFLVMSLKRNREVQHYYYDYTRFSLSPGSNHPRFKEIMIGGERANSYIIETLLEPGLFFFIGLILWGLGQDIGVLLVGCSIIYSLSYQAAYHKGDNYLRDKADERISSQELVKTFVEDLDPSKTQGFKFYGRRPADMATRRRVAEMLTDKDQIAVAV